MNALSHSISLEDTKLIITPLHKHVIAKMLIYVRAPIIEKKEKKSQLNLLNQPFFKCTQTLMIHQKKEM